MSIYCQSLRVTFGTNFFLVNLIMQITRMKDIIMMTIIKLIFSTD
jgi:hypothetical protein